MLDRRKFLKISTSLSTLTFLPHTLMAKNIEASKVSLGLVKNGQIITAAHWGILKLTIKDGKIIKSEPWEKITKNDNTLQHYTADMVYKSRIKYPYVRKSYLENPDHPKPELRGKDEFVRVSYDQAIKLIAKELKKQGMIRVQMLFLAEVMVGNLAEICIIAVYYFTDF